jgi:hypothetical protein
MEKKFSVIMLPTDTIDGALYLTPEKELWKHIEVNSPILSSVKWKDCFYQHLFLLSDDEIKEGDFYIHSGKEHNLPKAEYHNVCVCHKGLHLTKDYDSHINPHFSREQLFIDGMFVEDCRKIISSTDKSITPNSWIPDLFIEAYIKAYNEGKQIVEVFLEMERPSASFGSWVGHTLGLGTLIRIKRDGSVVINKFIKDGKEYTFMRLA